MNIYSTERTMNLRKLAGSKAGKITQKSLLVAMLLALTNNSQYEIVTDAWAGATQAAPAAPSKPTLKLSNSSPAITNNVIYVVEGQPVSICVSAADPNGYTNSLQFEWPTVTPAALNNNDVSFVSDSCGSYAAKYTWNTQLGDATNYPNVTLTFSVVNTYYSSQPKATKQVNIIVQKDPQPQFDAISNQTLTVGVPFKFPITATGEATSKNPVLLTAHATPALPKGAKLSKAVEKTSGKWQSTFSWTPTEAQYLAQTPATYTLSFIAKYKIPVETGDSQSDVKFTLVPPDINDAAIKQLTVSKAAWSVANSTLSTSGTVKFTHKFAMVTNLGVVLTNATTGEAITASPITVSDKGQWKLLNQPLTVAPCSITAKVVHINDGSQVGENNASAVVTKPVSKAPAGCA